MAFDIFEQVKKDLAGATQDLEQVDANIEQAREQLEYQVAMRNGLQVTRNYLAALVKRITEEAAHEAETSAAALEAATGEEVPALSAVGGEGGVDG